MEIEEMSKDKEVDGYYIKQAENFIDSLFDKGYFSDNLTRDDMRKIDELLAYLFQSYVDSGVRMSELTRKISKEG